MQTHRINHLCVDFSFGKKEKETALQQSRDIFYDQVLPQLDQQFSQCEEYIYIDKLEIEVGSTTPAEFELKFTKAFLETWNSFVFRHTELREKQSNAGVVIQRLQQEKDFAQEEFSTDDLLIYLQKGYWSWNIQSKKHEEIQELIKKYFESSNSKILFQTVALRKEISSERLLHLVMSDSSVQRAFLSALSSYHTFFVSRGISLEKLFAKEHREVALFFVRCLLQNDPVHEINQLIKVISDMRRLLLPSTTTIAENNAWKRTIVIFRDIVDAHGTREEIAEFESYVNEGQKSNLVENATQLYTSDVDLIEEKDKVPIINSGLILFHPYLRYAFHELNWINSELRFVNEDAQQKAILFLQFLVNGKSHQQEHQLVLNKIICNWPIAKPIKTRCHFSAREKSAMTNLIESLKEDWHPLKNTSREGLIKSFVERKGIISKNENNYLLQVEASTIDILMESLPFSIRVIKLPWNEYLIYSEWIQ